MSTYDDASLILIPSGVKDGKIYSAKPTNGDGDMTFTRASEASRVNSAGLIEKVRTNRLIQSQTLSGWGLQNITRTLTVDYATLTENNTTNSQYRANKGVTSTTGMMTISASVKSLVGTRQAYLDLGTVTGYFTFSTLATSSSLGTMKVVDEGGGWYRISLTASTTSSIGYVGMAVGNSETYTGDGVSAIGVRNVQHENGTVATDYIATTSVAVSEGPVANLPRLDYSGGATCPSLLLEPSRTNLWPSEYITSLLSSGATVDYNSTTSPDGYLNAMRLNSITSHSRVQLNNGTITGGYTGSVYVKSAGDYATLRLRLNTTEEQVQFNINTDGTVTRLTGDADYTITDAGNGWHRVTALFTAVGDSSNYFQIYADSSDGGSSVYIYGIQFELGNYSTSLISTYGTAATRVADACSKTGISSLIGQTEGTIFGQFNYSQDTGGTRRLISATDGSTNNRITTYIDSNDKISVYIVTSTSAQADIRGATSLVSGTIYKYAVSYKLNECKLYVNGVEDGTDSSLTVPACDELYLGSENGNNPSYFDWGKSILFPTALTDTELETLTTL